MKITSTIGRSWPAHGIVIKVGTNDLDVTDPARRALVMRLIGVYLESHQMTIEPEPAMPDAAKGVV